ncbi:lon protease homolog 1, mitochondrial-like [Brassica napus]|uniref:lon protease homolog 1, mitochondrial-like n=1 Tax=Brassica napus TaxID=3708 RepID=UPI00207B007D|nr:lon protease homolog 1, mitochondrial-like [Brassica napus]
MTNLHCLHIGEFTYPRLADFGAAICGANRHQAQEVLEELDVHKHLRLTLELMKKEREISKIRETIAKAIEEKISGEQRRYLLNEQLKAIKKELGVETDDKSALSVLYSVLVISRLPSAPLYRSSQSCYSLETHMSRFFLWEAIKVQKTTFYSFKRHINAFAAEAEEITKHPFMEFYAS